MNESSVPTLGVEEELHVVDLDTRELVPRAPEILRRLPETGYTAELHRSVVETNTTVCDGLDDLREELVQLRRRALAVAESRNLGLVSAGTVPLVNTDALDITQTARYRRMVDDYQILAREQLICGAQVHVGLPDRDVAVAVADRVRPWLPTLLAISASSPYWLGSDSGYASVRALVWQRWPTAGDSGGVTSAADHDALVTDLIASGVIQDPAMIYFDVRPSAHVPTLELRLCDACPEVDDVVLLAGLFRALVLRERAGYLAGEPAVAPRSPLVRAAIWRAARCGLEHELVALYPTPHPVPAANAVGTLLEDLRDQLEASGDWGQVSVLAKQSLGRGSAAARSRRAFGRRNRLTDVVDFLLEATRGGDAASALVGPVGAGSAGGGPAALGGYAAAGDEAFARRTPSAAYATIVSQLVALGPAGLRQREDTRDEEQRARGITFGVDGGASTRLFPFDLIPRVVEADDWRRLRDGLVQRAKALDMFVQDAYHERAAVADGVIPGWVLNTSPELRPSGALVASGLVRIQLAGMDLVRDAGGGWRVLEDNLRVPSGLGYAIQNRRLTQTVIPELPAPPGLLDVAGVPGLLREALAAAAPAGAPDDPRIVLLSQGPDDSAWFEHRLLAREMGIPLVVSTDLLVTDTVVTWLHSGVQRPVDVIYLRMDEDGLLHSPGADGRPLGAALLAGVHAGTVTLANALGNGIGDDKAVYAYASSLIEYYLGEKPLLADVPTYLCAIPEVRDEVLRRLDELVCKPVDGYGGDRVVIGPRAGDAELAALRRQLMAAPHRWIAQEAVALSTAPVFDGWRLAPRHVDLRAFVLQSGDGRGGRRAVVAPAALTRVAPAGSMIVNSSLGGGSKDTWLLGEDPGAAG